MQRPGKVNEVQKVESLDMSRIDRSWRIFSPERRFSQTKIHAPVGTLQCCARVSGPVFQRSLGQRDLNLYLVYQRASTPHVGFVPYRRDSALGISFATASSFETTAVTPAAHTGRLMFQPRSCSLRRRHYRGGIISNPQREQM